MSAAEEGGGAGDVRLEQVIKKSETGLVFYRRCHVDGQGYNVGNNVLLRDEGRYKLGYLLKIYCRTKGNERALVRWFFTDLDFGKSEPEQHCTHEIFATSYTGKVSVTAIRKLVHVIWVATKDEIPDSVPKDVYYVYRYFDHDKQALVLHREQLNQIRYMPKPVPDSVGSSLSLGANGEQTQPEIKFSFPYNQGGTSHYKVCTVGNDKYKIGDCVLLIDRDGSSIRRIISFYYNQDQRPIALGQFIYYQNEVTLTPEQRRVMHYQEVMVSNWKRELLISNIKKKLIVIHQNIFQPVPDNALKAVYFLKRYYDPFKKKIYPLSEPLTRSDFSIMPAPLEDSPHTPELLHPLPKVAHFPNIRHFKSCRIGEDTFSVGDYVTLQSGSVCVRVMRIAKGTQLLARGEQSGEEPVMDVNKLFTIRNVPSTDRSLLRSSLLYSSEVYHEVPCSLFFEKICVVFSSEDIENEMTYVAGDFFDAETKQLYKLHRKAEFLGPEDIPEGGMNLKKPLEKPVPESETSSSSEEEEAETKSAAGGKRKRTEKDSSSAAVTTPSKKTPKSDPKTTSEKKDQISEEEALKSIQKKERKQERKRQRKASAKAEKLKEDKFTKFQETQAKEHALYSEVMPRPVLVGEMGPDYQYKWVQVRDLKADLGGCVYVKLLEGVQLGRIISIYRDPDGVIRLKLYRMFLEEEMFVSKRESTTIHINEAFASDFLIHALACQLDELADVVFLKKKEKIPPQEEIPNGRLYLRRYYHPIRHLMRSLAQSLDPSDLTVLPKPHPAINAAGQKVEVRVLNKEQRLPKEFLPKTKPATESDAPKEAAADSLEGKVKNLDAGAGSSPSPLIQKQASPVKTSSSPPQSPGSTTAVQKISIVSESVSEGQTVSILPENMVSISIAEPVAGNQSNSIQIVEQSTSPEESQSISIALPGKSVENAASAISVSILQSDAGEIQISQGASACGEIQISQGAPECGEIQISQGASAVGEIQISQGASAAGEILISQGASEVGEIQICQGASTKESNPSEVVKEENNNQIQIVTSDSNQVQVISDHNMIQVVPSSETSDNTSSAGHLPTIISSEQDMPDDMNVDITHAEDGSITISQVTEKRNNTAKFEESYTENGKVYFRKCHFKDETIVQGDAVYVRCNDQVNEGDDSWKLGRAMEFYHGDYPTVRLLWFYVVEEMVTSKNEKKGIHPQEVFASQCFDQVEISSIESTAKVIYLQNGEKIPKDYDSSTLYCRKFYDPFKHSIKPLKTRLSASDHTILPEPVGKTPAKRGRPSATPQTPNSNVKRKKVGTPSSTPTKKVTSASSTPRSSPRKQPGKVPEGAAERVRIDLREAMEGLGESVEEEASRRDEGANNDDIKENTDRNSDQDIAVAKELEEQADSQIKTGEQTEDGVELHQTLHSQQDTEDIVSAEAISPAGEVIQPTQNQKEKPCLEAISSVPVTDVKKAQDSSVQETTAPVTVDTAKECTVLPNECKTVSQDGTKLGKVDTNMLVNEQYSQNENEPLQPSEIVLPGDNNIPMQDHIRADKDYPSQTKTDIQESSLES